MGVVVPFLRGIGGSDVKKKPAMERAKGRKKEIKRILGICSLEGEKEVREKKGSRQREGGGRKNGGGRLDRHDLLVGGGEEARKEKI